MFVEGKRAALHSRRAEKSLIHSAIVSATPHLIARRRETFRLFWMAHGPQEPLGVPNTVCLRSSSNFGI
jgi:hypothetical protein